MKKYFSLVKFSHSIFALPFAFIGFYLALRQPETQFHLSLLIAVILCMVFARSAAMAFNRWADEKYDKLNPRTAIRDIPSGRIKKKSAFIFVVVNGVLFIGTTWLINPICFYLSPVALAVVLGYSYTKRFTAFCHLFLGLGLSLSPIGAYLAVTGKFALLPILFSCIVFCWVSGFDIIYALQDDDFDRKNQLHSVPVWLGPKNGLLFSTLLHVIGGILVIIAGIAGSFFWLYWIGAALFIGMLVYQHLLVKPHDLSKINIAFMAANGIASIVFACFVVAACLFQ